MKRVNTVYVPLAGEALAGDTCQSGARTWLFWFQAPVSHFPAVDRVESRVRVALTEVCSCAHILNSAMQCV
jgi:hypothetical protein